MDAMVILTRPGKMREALKALEERRLDCWERCIRVTPNTGGDRVTSSRSIRGNEENLNAYAVLGTKVQEKQAEIKAAEEAVENLLDRFAVLPGRTSARDAEILRLRYLRGMKWGEVKRRLERGGYHGTFRALSYWHSAALRRFDLFLREMGKE